MSNFVPKGSSSESGVAKFIAGAGTPILEQVGAGESELGIAGQVQHRTGDASFMISPDSSTRST
jgi:hypothetical protein